MDVDALPEPTLKALDAHRIAIYTLTQKDRPIPTLQQMEEELKPDTTLTIKKRISDLKKQHLEDLERLYAWHAAEYLEDAKDKHLSKDELLYLAEGENNSTLMESYAYLEKIFEEGRRDILRQAQWRDHYGSMRVAHLTLLNSLYDDLRKVEKQEEEERKRRENAFPVSVADYNTKSKDVQMRVARFLMMNEVGRERVLSEFGWTSEQTISLLDIFAKDDAFKSSIIVLSMEQAQDPRRSRLTQTRSTQSDFPLPRPAPSISGWGTSPSTSDWNTSSTWGASA